MDSVNFCPICESQTNSRIISSYAKRLQLPENYQIAKCSRCGTSRLRPLPPENHLGSHYDDCTFYSVNSYQLRAESKIPLFKKRLQRLNAMLGQTSRKAILDFGCAGGHFLELAFADGWSPFGVEISKALANSASARIGNPVYNNIEDAVDSHYESLDAVHANHSIEHVRNPISTLGNINKLLRPGGILAIEVPYQFGSWLESAKIALIRLIGENAFRYFKPPVDSLHHIFFFNPSSVTYLLEKTGFKIENLSTVNKFYRQPKQRHGSRNILFNILEMLFSTVQKGTVIEVFARKINKTTASGDPYASVRSPIID